jgi:hypothetical protein
MVQLGLSVRRSERVPLRMIFPFVQVELMELAREIEHSGSIPFHGIHV